MKKFIMGAMRQITGRAMILAAALLAVAAFTGTVMADTISDTTTSVQGYVTAATVVGVAVLLFTLGRKVIRKLIVGLGLAALGMQFAGAATDIAGVTTDVNGYVTAATVVGVAVLLFTLGRKVIRKLI